MCAQVRVSVSVCACVCVYACAFREVLARPGTWYHPWSTLPTSPHSPAPLARRMEAGTPLDTRGREQPGEGAAWAPPAPAPQEPAGAGRD